MGEVVAHDDPALSNDSLLIRHINAAEHVIFDENLRANRINSAAFSRTRGDPDYGMSVDLGQVLTEQSKPLSTHVPVGMGAVSLRVSDVRDLGLPVGSDPEPHNDAHGQVWNVKDSKRNRLHKIALDWIVPIDGVRIR